MLFFASKWFELIIFAREHVFPFYSDVNTVRQKWFGLYLVDDLINRICILLVNFVVVLLTNWVSIKIQWQSWQIKWNGSNIFTRGSFCFKCTFWHSLINNDWYGLLFRFDLHAIISNYQLMNYGWFPLFSFCSSSFIKRYASGCVQHLVSA